MRVYSPPREPSRPPPRRRFAGAALLVVLTASCTPADWAAVNTAGAVAKTAACMICNGGAPAVGDAMAAHAEALREMTEALGKVAERKADPAEVEAIRRELQASHERERVLATRLLLLAVKPAEVKP